MNTERLKVLRDHISSLPPEKCDMGDYVKSIGGLRGGHGMAPLDLNNCGTAGCLAGYSVLLFGTADQVANSDYSICDKTYPDDVAANLFGLTEDEAEDLFQMSYSGYRFRDATQPAMVRVLDILIAEGVVDWDRAIEETHT